MPYQSFEDLDVWKRACQQAVTIVKEVEKFASFELKNQMTRAAISVPSNIAEGHGRVTPKDFSKFLRIALGSNNELKTQIYICLKLNLITPETGKSLIEENTIIAKMIQSLRKSLND
ncbi:four helix bundle protein [Rubritalea tangerina]|uniref:Four helix bundle protein n=1 Tax=Rubritalea tangerina TaxID=430798 RepID=A0ABW4Z6B0_9BACT